MILKHFRDYIAEVVNGIDKPNYFIVSVQRPHQNCNYLTVVSGLSQFFICALEVGIL
jgi:hypothetical protein